jgi:hypothetical protein
MVTAVVQHRIPGRELLDVCRPALETSLCPGAAVPFPGRKPALSADRGAQKPASHVVEAQLSFTSIQLWPWPSWHFVLVSRGLCDQISMNAPRAVSALIRGRWIVVGSSVCTKHPTLLFRRFSGAVVVEKRRNSNSSRPLTATKHSNPEVDPFGSTTGVCEDRSHASQFCMIADGLGRALDLGCGRSLLCLAPTYTQ